MQHVRAIDVICAVQVRTHAMEQYALRGIHLHPGTSPERIVKNDDGSVTLYAKTKGGQEVVETAEHVLMATGRKANTDNLGLEKVSPPSLRCEFWLGLTVSVLRELHYPVTNEAHCHQRHVMSSWEVVAEP